jgi:hypothetical protein
VAESVDSAADVLAEAAAGARREASIREAVRMVRIVLFSFNVVAMGVSCPQPEYKTFNTIVNDYFIFHPFYCF